MPGLADTTRILGRAISVGGHIASEKLRRYAPESAEEVPASAAMLTPEWLTAVLCGNHPGAQVLGFESVDGHAGTSSRRRIRIRYNAAGQAADLPTVLYTKSTAQWTQRMVLGLAGVIGGEALFFSRIRPTLEIEAPRGYHAVMDPRSWRSITLMEDIAETRGASFCSPATHISFEDMDDLLGSIAGWQGATWNSPRFGQDWSGLMRPKQFLARTKSLIAMQKRSLIGAQRAQAVIPAALFPKQAELWRGLERSFDLLSQGDTTLIHGDSHIGNTYRTADGRMGFGDWQIIQQGGWAYDVSYVMATGLRVEDRRAWERDLLQRYGERLRMAGGPALGEDVIWDGYRQALMYPYFAWVFTIGAGTFQPAMQPDHISLPIIERTAQAIDDLGALETLR